MVLPTYQITLYLYSPSVDIYDSPHLIVDTLLLKVVQGSYLFTVNLASLSLSAIGLTSPKPRQLAQTPQSLLPESGNPPGPIQGASNETKEVRASASIAIR